MVAADFPFLGACYGIGVLGTLAGGVVDRTFGEPIGALAVRLTDDGREDPLFGDDAGRVPRLPRPQGGGDPRCPRAPCCSPRPTPARCTRSGSARHVYATQFHPELDAVAICDRIDAYSSHGYYAPHEQEALKDAARQVVVTEPVRLLARFVELYARG